VRGFGLAAACGIVLALALTASPLTIVAIGLAVAVIATAGRGVPADERRALVILLAIGFGARLAVITGAFLAGLPHHSDVSVGGLSGDDAYYFDRAMRARDLMLGFAAGKYDYFIVSDAYGQTSYLTLLTWMQVAAGPTPYGMRAINAVMYIAGAALLYRTVRTGFGSTPALIGLTLLLFLPSLFVWSISLLKESMFFLITATLIAAAARVFRAPRDSGTIALIVIAAVCVWLLDDLRRGGSVLAIAGLALALIARFLFARPSRVAIAAIIVAIVVTAAATSDAARQRFTRAATQAAQVHAGHVFTVGHAYKLLDAGFYMHPGTPEGLTFEQSLRFVARAGASFLLTPLPWQVESRGELALLPEHVLWYVMLVLAPIGLVAGWRRDPLLTCMLAGYAIPTAVTLALTNGNVGTLLRLRALVTPQLAWIGALGLVAVAGVMLERSASSPSTAVVAEPAR
jgi:hypothetical protein